MHFVRERPAEKKGNTQMEPRAALWKNWFGAPRFGGEPGRGWGSPKAAVGRLDHQDSSTVRTMRRTLGAAAARLDRFPGEAHGSLLEAASGGCVMELGDLAGVDARREVLALRRGRGEVGVAGEVGGLRRGVAAGEQAGKETGEAEGG